MLGANLGIEDPRWRTHRPALSLKRERCRQYIRLGEWTALRLTLTSVGVSHRRDPCRLRELVLGKAKVFSPVAMGGIGFPDSLSPA